MDGFFWTVNAKEESVTMRRTRTHIHAGCCTASGRIGAGEIRMALIIVLHSFVAQQSPTGAGWGWGRSMYFHVASELQEDMPNALQNRELKLGQ